MMATLGNHEDQATLKLRAARGALELVESGMTVGLGSGRRRRFGSRSLASECVTIAWIFALSQVQKIANAWDAAMESVSSILRSAEASTSPSTGPTKSRPSSHCSREGAANCYARRLSPARRSL